MAIDKLLKSIPGIFLVITVIVIYQLIGCPFRFLFGIPCPGCGMTRAWLSFLQGDFIGAFRWHPLFPVVFPFILIIIVKNGRLFKHRISNLVFINGFVFLFIAVYAIRMYLLFPYIDPMAYNSEAVINKVILLLRGR